LAVPWGIAFLPDGSAFVSERDAGRIVRIPAGGGAPLAVRTLDVLAGGDTGGEGGLLGLALHPSGSWLYAYLTTESDNRVVRMRTDGHRLDEPEPVLTGISSATHHNGGALAFAPDGSLYVATGDAEDRSSATERGSLNGKVLRITDTGEPAPGNPWWSAVFTMGHRNVEGLAFDEDGGVWASEFGDKAADELNLLVGGQDYGWPSVEGSDGAGGFSDPLAEWSTDECSPAGLAIAGGHAFLGALRGQCLWSVDLATGESSRWLEEFGRLRLVTLAPDGSLWVGTSNHDGRGDPDRRDDRIFRVAL
jgi:glucose/arabinose dehydrogenase